MCLTTYIFCPEAYLHHLKFKILMIEMFEKSIPRNSRLQYIQTAKKKKKQQQLFKGLQLVRWGLKSAQVCSQLQWNQICLYVGKSICRSLPSDRWWVGPAWLMVEEKRKAEGEKLLVEQWFIIHWEKCNVKKYRVLADISALNQLKQFYLGELQPETTVHLCHHSVCLSTKWSEGFNKQKGRRLEKGVSLGMCIYRETATLNTQQWCR